MKILDSHIRLEVKDLAEAKQYIGQILGMTPLRRLSRPQAGEILWYPGLEIAQAGLPQEAAQVNHVAWQVDDIKMAMRVLKENGVTFETEEPREVDRTFLDTKEVVQFVFFTTPFGLRAELYQINPPAEHP